MGYSGGIDSSVMLHLAVKATKDSGHTLKALHVNHGVSKDAKDWQMFCERQCEEQGIECITGKFDLSPVEANFEQAARVARYAFFSKHLSLGDVLLTAHHQGDQAETVLMRSLRGTGVKGLSAIAAGRNLGEAQLVRPLLEFAKADIVAYAEQNNIRWVEDASNQDSKYDRNFLRNQVLPLLKSRWPDCERALSKLACNTQLAQGLLNELGAIDIESCLAVERKSYFDLVTPLSWKQLSTLSIDRTVNIIDAWTSGHFEYAIRRAQLMHFLTQLREVSGESMPMLEHERSQLRYYNGCVHLLGKISKSDLLPLRWNLKKPLELPSIGIRLEALDIESSEGVGAANIDPNNVSVCWRRGGERINQRGRVHSQSYKKCLQEARVPPWERDYLPLIKSNEQIVWSGALETFTDAIFNANGRAIRFVMYKVN